MCLYVKSPLGTSVSNEQEAGSSTPEKKKKHIHMKYWLGNGYQAANFNELICVSSTVPQGVSLL